MWLLSLKNVISRNISPARCIVSKESVTMTATTVKYDWYQTETSVVVSIRIKDCNPKDVELDVKATTLSFSNKKQDTGSLENVLNLNLAHPITPEKFSMRTFATKVEITLQKEEPVRWVSLEGDGSKATPTGGACGPKYPTSSGKDWNKIAADIDKNFEEEKADGEAALNQMFQKIYADSTDDVKKAMNKSFSESGGTVLSTNWDEIKSGKVDCKPPDGMEFKKWE